MILTRQMENDGLLYENHKSILILTYPKHGLCVHKTCVSVIPSVSAVIRLWS